MSDKLNKMSDKLNKHLTGENQIENIDQFIYSFGLIKKQNESRNYRLFRYFVMSIAVLFLLRSTSALIIYIFKSNQVNRFERFLVWIGDYTYYIPKLRFHANIVFNIFIVQILLTQFLHNKLLFSNGKYRKFHWFKLFDMLSGKIKPSKLGFNHWDDVILFTKR